MSAQMILISPNRLEFHPAFVAELFATWRVNWPQLQDDRKIAELARAHLDDGWDVQDAITAARYQMHVHIAQTLATRVWIEYLNAADENKKRGSKLPPKIGSNSNPDSPKSPNC